MRVTTGTASFAMVGLCLMVGLNSLGCNKAKAIDPQQFLLAEEPAGAQNVIETYESAADEDEVVVVGRIGGSKDPWVDGVAAFEITDLSLRACSDETGEGETCSCRTPWDYCCEDVSGCKVTVRIVDEQGDLLEEGAKELFDLEELMTVVVQGTFEREEDGTIRILATGLHIR